MRWVNLRKHAGSTGRTVIGHRIDQRDRRAAGTERLSFDPVAAGQRLAGVRWDEGLTLRIETEAEAHVGFHLRSPAGITATDASHHP
jgi:hypothetical protein